MGNFKQTYTFWYYGGMMTFYAESVNDAMAQANDHFEPDDKGAWKYRADVCYRREFVWS